MNGFDKNILVFLNSFVGRWPHIDVFIVHFQYDNLLKGGIFLAMLWYLWFAPSLTEREHLEVRKKLFSIICSMLVGIVAARSMATLLPFRLRPLANPELHFLNPGPVDLSWVIAWSSFPSDHAVVWFALAVGVFCVHRTLGVFAIAYAVFLGLGRIYTGFHNPTDILAGAMLGAGLSIYFCRKVVRNALYARIENFQTHYPGWFYALAFLVTFEASNMFDQVRSLTKLSLHAISLFVK